MDAMQTYVDPFDASTEMPWLEVRASIEAVAFNRWDPIRDLLAIQQRLDRFAPGPAGWAPPVDLQELPDSYVLTAEVPGLQRDDLEIRMHEGHLTVSGVRREPQVPYEQFHRVERGHGSFSRSFLLPVPVDAARVVADLRVGVLTVICPKAADAWTRRIAIG
jgi:HSP20 family protein